MTNPFPSATMTVTTSSPLSRLAVPLASVLVLTLSLALSACGGGGSDSAPATPAVPTTPTSTSTSTSTLTQGRWISTGLTPAYTAIMVPATTGANTPAVDTVWALAQDASTLIKLKANGAAQMAGAVTGTVYTLGTTSVAAVTSGSYNLQANASNPASQQMSLQPVLGTTALFERTDVMSAALKAEQANGKWQADLGTVKITWSVDTSAANVKNLSGTSTTGCTYSGQSTVVTAQSLYKVDFTETCSGSASSSAQTFVGIATLNADSTRLTVVASNEAETRAAAMLFVKQP